MEKPAPSDPELLTEWLVRHREPAFHALVARYAGLVHATARRTCGDDSMAAEASQLTFITLAQKAKSLVSCASLGGWLHLTALMQAKNLIRKSQREIRKRQLLQAAMETEPPHASADVWMEMQPVLDEALASLSENDREALLLRFYRSLSIREIAATLGIATDAAQKRIDRATERLRGKLARRGVQAGGSLSAAMVAGFTADAQAVVLPVSVIATKAISAGAASAITSTAIVAALTTAMKSTSFIIPAVVLISTAALVAMQRQSIRTLKGETALLLSRISTSDSSTALSSAKPLRPKTEVSGDEPINWNDFVNKYEEMRQRGRLRSENMGWARLIEGRLQSMSKEQLVAELERIAALEVPAPYPDLIKEMVMSPLIKKAPELGLTQFMEHPSSDSDNWHEPNAALKQWAMADLEKATAWLDAQIDAGKFDSKSLDGKNPLRILFERTLIGVLLTSDPEAVSRRVGILPENQRADVLLGQPVDSKNQDGFARLVRQQVPAYDQTKVLAELTFLSISMESYEAATECLDRVAATPVERTAYIEHVAVTQFQQLARNGKITEKHVDSLREWTDSVSPESTDFLTAKALGRASAGGGRQTSFAELGALAVKYSRSSGSDDVLVEYLKEPASYFFNKEEARALTSEIADQKRRKEVLDYFDANFPTR